MSFTRFIIGRNASLFSGPFFRLPLKLASGDVVGAGRFFGSAKTKKKTISGGAKGKDTILQEKWLDCYNGFNYNLADSMFNADLNELKEEFQKLRVFTATPTLLDDVIIKLDGDEEEYDIKSLGQVIIKNPQSMLVHVHEESSLKNIVTALRKEFEDYKWDIDADSKSSISISIPRNCAEHRENLFKTCKIRLEKCKNDLRGSRQNILKDLGKMKNVFGVDETFRIEQEVEKRFSKYSESLTAILKAKKKELNIS